MLKRYLSAFVIACTSCTPIQSDQLIGGDGFDVITVTPAVVNQMHRDMRLERASLFDFQREAMKVRQEAKLATGDRILFNLSILSPGGVVVPIFPTQEDPRSIAEFTIMEQGTINLPHIGLVHIAGLTLEEARLRLHEAYTSKNIYKNPVISLEVIEYGGHTVTVLGEVVEAGSYIIKNDRFNLLSAISAARGVLRDADLKHVTIRHADGTVTPVDAHAMLTGNTDANKVSYYLTNGDVIFIPSVKNQPVVVTGEVKRAGIFFIRNGDLSALGALMETEGYLQRTADRGHMYVVRSYPMEIDIPDMTDEEVHAAAGTRYSANVNHDAIEQVKVYHFDIRQPQNMIMAGKFPLQKHDIVYLAAKPVSQWSRFINQILPGNINSMIVSGVAVDDEL